MVMSVDQAAAARRLGQRLVRAVGVPRDLYQIQAGQVLSSSLTKRP